MTTFPLEAMLFRLAIPVSYFDGARGIPTVRYWRGSPAAFEATQKSGCGFFAYQQGNAPREQQGQSSRFGHGGESARRKNTVGG